MKRRTYNPDAGERIVRLRRELRGHAVQAVLVTDPVNVGYLTGFTGEDSWLVAGRGPAWLVTDFRYAEQAEAECPDLRLAIRRGPMAEALLPVVRRKRIEALGVEAEAASLAVRRRLGKALRGVRLVPIEGLVGGLRMRKDPAEVRAVRRAIRVAEHAWAEFRRRIRPGMTERRLAAELEYQMRLAGAEGPAFPTICAVGASASMPHARPGNRRLRRGTVLLVDFGAKVGGYVCDLTRVLVAGRIPPRVRRAYEAVREAQSAAIARVGPGVSFQEVDAAARGVLEAAGLAERFQHGTGHGLGRQVHEPPALGPRGPQGRLEPGMIVTVEPAVYFRGRFGIRIEDDVLVTPTGRRVLTTVEKDWEAMVL